MKIIFVSFLTPIQMDATSTDITTDGIIKGLYQNNNKIILVLFANEITDDYKSLIENAYINMVDKIIYIKSSIGKNKGKYSYLLKLYLNLIFNKNKYKKIILDILNEIDNDTIILSHSPTLDSIMFCRELKKYCKSNLWIQYWSDPITLSGINPENYSIKRLPFKALESYSLSLADEVVYGPKTLMFYQSNFFPKFKHKMRGVDLFFIENNYSLFDNDINSNYFLYAGNYYKYSRNIQILFNSFQELGDRYNLIVYGSGDQSPPNCNNIIIMERVSPNDLYSIERKYTNIICLMNSRSIQIPGKIFYNMNNRVNILVIVDGIHGSKLKEYLESYNRFILVNNDLNSIKDGIKMMSNFHYNLDYINNNYSPKKIVKEILNMEKIMNKKIILYFHHGSSSGGAPRSLSFLIDKLDKNVYEPYVVCFMDFDRNNRLFTKSGAKVIYAPMMRAWHGSTVTGMNLTLFLSALYHYNFNILEAKRLVEKIRPDIIHLNSTCLWPVAKSVKKNFPNIKIICHVREPLMNGFFGNILRKNCNKYVDEFIAIEKYDLDSLKTKKKSTVISNFVDFNVYNSSLKSKCLRDEFSLDDDDFIILYLAIISPSNGTLEMINKLKELLISNNHIHLFIIGMPDECRNQYHNAIVEASSYDNIHLLQFRNDIPNIIADSDLNIVPFIAPHFARSVIEAAAMGVPSIVSDVDGLKDLVINNKTGLIFNHNTFEDLNDKVLSLYEDREFLKTLGTNAEEYAKREFNADINANRTFEVYKNILK